MKQEVKTLENRLIHFAVAVTKMIEKMPVTRSNSNLIKQLIRSCSSPALNYAEAQPAESKSDFIHKMRICLKELKETHVNLRIIYLGDFIEKRDDMKHLVDECGELVAIFVSSIKTALGK